MPCPSTLVSPPIVRNEPRRSPRRRFKRGAGPTSTGQSRTTCSSSSSRPSHALRRRTRRTRGPRACCPLTDSFHGAPASHDGRSAITFELRFTEAPQDDFRHTTLRDHAFAVSGGAVVKARRLRRGRNFKWEITIRPHGHGAVVIPLPATTGCEAEGARCTEDGRMLSDRLEREAAARPGGNGALLSSQ